MHQTCIRTPTMSHSHQQHACRETRLQVPPCPLNPCSQLNTRNTAQAILKIATLAATPNTPVLAKLSALSWSWRVQKRGVSRRGFQVQGMSDSISNALFKGLPAVIVHTPRPEILVLLVALWLGPGVGAREAFARA